MNKNAEESNMNAAQTHAQEMQSRKQMNKIFCLI